MKKPHLVKKEKPFFVKLLLCCISSIIFFVLGYSVFLFHEMQSFLAVSTRQTVPIHQTTSLPALPNQTNILLLGSDNDQKFTGNPLTQTMMVVHIDYTKKEVTLFSIPRDLWVKMPDRNIYGKIDQAAEYTGIPSAIDVVEQTFGIAIDHYVWVGLYGFIKSIDSLNGVNLQVVHPVLDNSYPTDINSTNPYGYQRLDIQPGMQHMSGEEALQYVRSRHEDLIGDFGRTQRQRQLLLTLKQTLVSSRSNILQIPQLFDTLKGQVKTDMTVLTALQLGTFFLTNKNYIALKQVTLAPPTYSHIGNSTDGQSIVIGDATASATLITNIFNSTAGQTTYTSLANVQNIQP